MQTRFPVYLKKILTTKNRLPVLTIIVASLLIVSCKKGDTGPAGVAGPAGTANVIYSAWFTPATYTKETIFGTYGFKYDKAITEITQKILDSGTVITFGKLNGYNPIIWPTDQIAQMPISLTYLSGTDANIDTWSALLSLGNLEIRLVSSLNAYSNISNAHQFRYVIIPGGTKSTVALTKLGLVNGNAGTFLQMSYAEICQRLGMPE
ncbi:MAG TPA: hypothetical protein VK563_15195 [Puia sp.]|nr:hypothetical protein [Puia sp.]